MSEGVSTDESAPLYVYDPARIGVLDAQFDPAADARLIPPKDRRSSPGRPGGPASRQAWTHAGAVSTAKHNPRSFD